MQNGRSNHLRFSCRRNISPPFHTGSGCEDILHSDYDQGLHIQQVENAQAPGPPRFTFPGRRATITNKLVPEDTCGYQRYPGTPVPVLLGELSRFRARFRARGIWENVEQNRDQTPSPRDCYWAIGVPPRDLNVSIPHPQYRPARTGPTPLFVSTL